MILFKISVTSSMLFMLLLVVGVAIDNARLVIFSFVATVVSVAGMILYAVWFLI